MKRFPWFIITFFLSLEQALAAAPADLLITPPSTSIIQNTDKTTPIAILSLVQGFVLKIVFPIVVIGVSLYIAYQLFTAEGDEAQLKKAWKSVAYSSIALISVAISYALVSVITRLSL